MEAGRTNQSTSTYIFVHGSPGSAIGWSSFLADERLASQARLIAFDRPGYGGSSRCTCRKTLFSQAMSLHQCIESLVPDGPISIVGHSYGGPLALALADLTKDKVAFCLLLSAALDPALEKTLFIQRLASLQVVAAMLPLPLRSCNSEIIALKHDLEQLKLRLPNLSFPITIIHGDEDGLVPIENVSYLEKHAIKSRIQVHILKGRNHYIPWTETSFILSCLMDSLLNEGPTGE
jgi:pimeloyl-ACP methyl ester carboxylesterase